MKEIYDLAEQYHNDGNNCVESVVKACNDGLKLGLPAWCPAWAAVSAAAAACAVR